MPTGHYNRVTAFQRANCHVCGRDTAVRGGRLHVHSSRWGTCAGAGQPPQTEVRGTMLRRNSHLLYRVEWDDTEIHHRESIEEAWRLAVGALRDGHSVTIIPVNTRPMPESSENKHA